MVNVYVDYMLKSNDKKVVVNDYIENEPLSDNNLSKTLDLVNKIRLSIPSKSIWLYSGYKWEHIFDPKWHYHPKTQEKLSIGRWRRQKIVSQCNVFIDGEFIDSQQNLSLTWKGSKTKNVIYVQKSLSQSKIYLYCD